VAGAALGGVLGWLGSPAAETIPSSDVLWTLAAMLATGALVDARVGGLALPTFRRQVNEDWLHRYRGWVYGAGFGVQLGLGFATIMTTAAVPAAFAAALLSGSARAGMVVGATFGAVRGATLFGAARVKRVDQLLRVEAWLRRWDRAARAGAIVIQVVLAGAVAAAALRGGA
jgi:hypothetical protein